MNRIHIAGIAALGAIVSLLMFSTPASAQAPSLQLNGQASGFLNESEGHDWWQITLPSDGSLIVSTHADTTLDVDLAIYDTDGETLITGSAAVGVDEDTDIVALMPGTYFIKAICWGDGEGNYTIANTFVAATLEDDPELNNDADHATTLAVNSSDTGHLGYESLTWDDGYDWWQITLPSDGSLTVSTQSDSILDVDLYLYDTDKETELDSGIDFGPDEQISHNALTPGTYYIQAEHWSGYGAYTISATFTPTRYANDSEPNNEIGSAVSVPVLTTLYGHLGHYTFPTEDVDDFITFTVPANWDTLFIRSESDSTLYVDLTLLSADGETTIGSESAFGPIEVMTFTDMGGSTFALKLHSFGGGWGAYALIISNSTAAVPDGGVVVVHDDTSAPNAFSLSTPYPNPFNPRTSVSFTTPEFGRVSIVVYDILGRKTAVLLDDMVSPGMHMVTWDTRDDLGNLSASGVYLIRVDAGTFHDQRKVMLMR